MAEGQKTGGRKAGSRNKATAEVKATLEELARSHTEAALNTLVRIMDSDEAPPAARVSAANIILDRAYGRPRQAIDAKAGITGPITFCWQPPDRGE